MSRHHSRVRHSLPVITVAGCLAIVYATFTASPVFADFMRALGAREGHFGLLSGIPMAMLAMQFLGAHITNHLRSRKALFMVLAIAGRALYLGIALLPLLFWDMDRDVMLIIVIGLVSLSAGLSNMVGPPWFSWMADLIPHSILSRYWGRRQRAMHMTWTACYVGIIVFAWITGWPAKVLFPILAVVGVLAGVTDILLFKGVEEPPNTRIRGQAAWKTITAPLRNRDYRSFVVFSCAWSAAGMFAAAFMQLYALEVLALSVGQATFVWSFLGVGVALSSGFWGRLADRYGHRPIIVFCMVLKPVIVMVFLLVTPGAAVWVLSISFLIDSMWNAGIAVASNGYMLKTSPTENRSMYIAALTGLTGICGGLGSMAGGAFLEAFSDFSALLLGRTWNNFQLLFLVDIFLRSGCILLALRIREPKSSSSPELVHALWGIWPMRFIIFPVGLYRLWTRRDLKDEGGGQDDIV